jgi:hypothetical protein
MKEYFKCTFFDKKDFSIIEKFRVIQPELKLEGQLADLSGGAKYRFRNEKINYECVWQMQNNWSSQKPTLLIPIRNSKKLIDITIKNLIKTRVSENANIIIIDDRSTEDIRTSALENNLSYLRIDNSKGFNFSMLNNIAAKICYDLGVGTIILWNSDLWCVREEWFLNLIKKHDENNSTISGSKLLYPPANLSISGEEDSENIKHTFPHMTGGKWRETVQFGGSIFIKLFNQHLNYAPNHFLRFGNKDDPRVNCDKGENFVTGALQVINLKWFIENGGLNPSLKKGFQDVDLCFKALKSTGRIFYFGKDLYFYHDESLNFYTNKDEKKFDDQAASDHVIFGKIWNDLFEKLIFN